MDVLADILTKELLQKEIEMLRVENQSLHGDSDLMVLYVAGQLA
jgi:hypothetical protein